MLLPRPWDRCPQAREGTRRAPDAFQGHAGRGGPRGPKSAPGAPPRGSCGFPHGAGHGRSQDLPGRARGSIQSGAGGGPPARRPETPETAAVRSGPRLPCCQRRRTREGRGLEEPGAFPQRLMDQRLLLLRLLTRCCPLLSRQHPHRTLKSWGSWESASGAGSPGVPGAGRPEGSFVHGVFVPRDQQDVVRPQL